MIGQLVSTRDTRLVVIMVNAVERCQRVLAPWTRLTTRHPWSHNDAYGWWIALHGRRLRTGRPRSALDIGCGTGNLLARLAGVVDQVTGIEPDAATADAAVASFSDDPRVRVIRGTFDDRPPGEWDLVTLVAVLHHLPLEATLRSLRTMIKPGGRLVVVGLSRETRRDLPWSVVSVLLNPLIGLIVHPRADGVLPTGMTAPVAEPRETFEQIRDAARAVLPGVQIRRGPFFRYRLTWTRNDHR